MYFVCYLTFYCRNYFSRSFSGHNHNLRPTHRRDAHRKFFWWSLLKLKSKFFALRRIFAALGSKGLSLVTVTDIRTIDTHSKILHVLLWCVPLHFVTSSEKFATDCKREVQYCNTSTNYCNAKVQFMQFNSALCNQHS